MQTCDMAPSSVSCCFTGHRPEHLPWGRNEKQPEYQYFYKRLTQAVESMIEKGCCCFYCGMAQGVDTYAAQIILGLRDANPEKNIKFIAVCPHASQADRWSPKDKQLHHLLLNLADDVVYIEQEYTPSCFHRRNRYMVDRCDYVIAGFNGTSKGGTSSTVAYARRKNKQITIVPPV